MILFFKKILLHSTVLPLTSPQRYGTMRYGHIGKTVQKRAAAPNHIHWSFWNAYNKTYFL